jgi:tRNA (cytidine32/uridine32-2'-O)-methyltransferase
LNLTRFSPARSGRSAQTGGLRLHRLFHHAKPDSRELRTLHGVLADAERMARWPANQRGDKN